MFRVRIAVRPLAAERLHAALDIGKVDLREERLVFLEFLPISGMKQPG